MDKNSEYRKSNEHLMSRNSHNLFEHKPVKFSDLKLVHFVGIGGAGMSVLAEILNGEGIKVQGSDAKESSFTEILKKNNITVFIGHNAENVRNADAVVYSSAIKEDNPEIVEAGKEGIPLLHRSQMLSLIMDQKEYSVCIAGSHGKTTTTSLTVSLLQNSEDPKFDDPCFAIGGSILAKKAGTDAHDSLNSVGKDRDNNHATADTVADAAREVASDAASDAAREVASDVASDVAPDTAKALFETVKSIAQNYEAVQGGRYGKSPIIVAEADESDSSFLNYHPTISIITNAEPDHIDFYGSNEAFINAFIKYANQTKQTLILNIDDRGARHVYDSVKGNKRLNIITFAVENEEADVLIKNTVQTPTGIDFELFGGGNPPSSTDPAHDDTAQTADGSQTAGDSRSTKSDSRNAKSDSRNAKSDSRSVKLGQFHINMPGKYNSLNATASVLAAHELGISYKQCEKALLGFVGVNRRFEYKGVINGITVIDDYAHHPTEVESLIKSTKQIYKSNKVRAVFQPHLFSRTMEFAKEFAAALDNADDVIVAGIYPAREEPIKGVDANTVAKELNKEKFIKTNERQPIAEHGTLRKESESGKNKTCGDEGKALKFAVEDRFEAGEDMLNRCDEGDILLLVGAGNIGEVGDYLIKKFG